MTGLSHLAGVVAISWLALAASAASIPVPPKSSGLSARQTTTSGFSLFEPGSLSDTALSSTCVQTLQQTINCDPFVQTFQQQAYYGSLEDLDLTNKVCLASCSTALATARRRIAGACASTPNLYDDYPVLTLVDSIVSAWNETCLKDSDGQYCNEKIAAFDDVDELEDLPQTQLCSFCFGEKLRMMQRSPYSVYDDFYASQLKIVNEKCGKTGSTDPLTSPSNTTIPERNCLSGSSYVVKAGDTCDSISQSHKVSAPSLYYTNPDLHNCSAPDVGQRLCLPLPCANTYTVNKTDSCIDVGLDHGTTWRSIVAWNAGVNDGCNNLWSDPASSQYRGNVICVSVPGGLPTTETGNGTETGTTPGNGGIGGPGGSGNGYADTITDAPPASQGAVAEGTTSSCGYYVKAESDSACDMLVAEANVPMGLFIKANPSLMDAATCTANLKAGQWYCLRPVRGFDA